MKYTVVGYFLDNNQVWIEHVLANDWMDAFRQAIKQIKLVSKQPADNIMIVEVFNGHHKGQSEHETTCLASDMRAIIAELSNIVNPKET